MRDRGLPIVDGAPACPFVAFEDDRDARAGGADHRHRCFAEVRAAPRALAHQEAFCLSAAFPACPTFQDWARREAASINASDEAAESAPPTEPPRSAGSRSARDGSTDPNRRNPPRDWAAPPPWLSGRSPRSARPDAVGDPIRGALEDDFDDAPLRPPPGGGLAGSFADRLVSGAGDPFTERPPIADRTPQPPPPAAAPVEADLDDDDDADDDREGPGAVPSRSSIPRHLGPGTTERPRQPARDGVARRTPDPAAPAWERPRRMEAYPTIRSRRLPSFGGSSIILGFIAVLIAAAALFFLPGLLGIGEDGPNPTPTPTTSAGPTPAASTASLEPTVKPAPTGDVYIVEPGDTMSRIANKFGIPLGLLIEANKETIPDPDALQIGDAVIIPALPPTSIPGASPSASGSPAP